MYFGKNRIKIKKSSKTKSLIQMEHLDYQLKNKNENPFMNDGDDNKFNWGDTALIKKNAPPHLHPGEIVSICSVIKIDPDDVKKDPSLIESTWLYTGVSTLTHI